MRSRAGPAVRPTIMPCRWWAACHRVTGRPRSTRCDPPGLRPVVRACTGRYGGDVELTPSSATLVAAVDGAAARARRRAPQAVGSYRPLPSPASRPTVESSPATVGRSDRGFAQQPAAQTAGHGPSGLRASTGPPAVRSSHQVGDRRDEGRVGARRREPDHPHAELVAGLAGLVVEVPDHLNVVAHEADRDDHGGAHPRRRGLAKRVVDVRLEPRDAGCAAPGLVDERPCRQVRTAGAGAIENTLDRGQVLRDIGASGIEPAGRSRRRGHGNRDRVRGEEDAHVGDPITLFGQAGRTRPRGRPRTGPRSQGGRSSGGSCRWPGLPGARPPRASAPGPRGTAGTPSRRRTRWSRWRARDGGRRRGCAPARAPGRGPSCGCPSRRADRSRARRARPGARRSAAGSAR